MIIRAFALIILPTLILVFWSTGAFGAEEYANGHGALEVFDEAGFAATPLWVRIWLGFLMLTFASGLAFVWNHALARWAVGGFVLGMVTGTPLFNLLGLPMLSGAIAIVHIVFWMPAFFLLLKARPFLNQELGLAFRIWSGAMTSTIAFSFIFDFRDAFIYLSHVAT